jgi:hypothetical protein
MTNISILYPDFDWIEYKLLNPYLYICGLRTKEDYINNFILEGRFNGRIYKKNQIKKYSFHILIATIGKDSIFKMLELLKNQLNDIDYLTIVFDGKDKSKNIDLITNYCTSFKCNINIIIEENNLGFWGHGIRNKYNDLKGDFVYHIDDDDIIYSNTFDIIRKHCNDINRIYIFKIILENNKVVWNKPEIKINYISTQSGVIPTKFNKDSYWHLKYGGDYFFYETLSKKYDMIFIDKIIYKKN